MDAIRYICYIRGFLFRKVQQSSLAYTWPKVKWQTLMAIDDELYNDR